MVVTRLIKNLYRRPVKQGRKVNSNKITTRGVITGRSHAGRDSKGTGTALSQKMSDGYGKIEASVV
jgi:hypothetical protein